MQFCSQCELISRIHLAHFYSPCLSHFQIHAAPVVKIDFSSAKSKKQKLDDAIAGKTGEQRCRLLNELVSMKDETVKDRG